MISGKMKAAIAGRFTPFAEPVDCPNKTISQIRRLIGSAEPLSPD